MKKLLLTFIALSIISCKNDNKLLAENSETINDNDPYKELYGNWVGDFIPVKYDENAEFIVTNKINIIIKKIANNKVYGQSIVAGNIRTIEGVLRNVNHKLEFILNEPGNDKNDGKFKFQISKGSLFGNWFSNNKKITVSERKYSLVKQEFKYNATLMLPKEDVYVDYNNPKIDSTEYIDEEDGNKVSYDKEETYRFASEVVGKLNASTTKLAEKDIKNLKKLELELIRNTIFARHGYTFKIKTVRQFFDRVDWYIPISKDVTNELTSLEKENIKLLERFEKYATDNYESFGR